MNCGLCCNGIMFSRVSITPEELQKLEQSGFSVEIDPIKPGSFLQPCRLLLDSKCSAYDVRPSTCRNYTCKLLQKYRSGEIGLEEAKAITTRGRDLARALEDVMQKTASYRTLWANIIDVWEEGDDELGRLENRRQHGAFLMSAVSLLVHLKKHFLSEKKSE